MPPPFTMLLLPHSCHSLPLISSLSPPLCPLTPHVFSSHSPSLILPYSNQLLALNNSPFSPYFPSIYMTLYGFPSPLFPIFYISSSTPIFNLSIRLFPPLISSQQFDFITTHTIMVIAYASSPPRVMCVFSPMSLLHLLYEGLPIGVCRHPPDEAYEASTWCIGLFTTFPIMALLSPCTSSPIALCSSSSQPASVCACRLASSWGRPLQ